MAVFGWLVLGALAGQLLQLAIWYAVPAIANWRARRRARRAQSVGTSSTLASLAKTYKRMYAPDTATQMANRSPIAFSELRKRKFHVVGAIDGGHAITYPEAAAEVESAIAAAHEELAKSVEAREPLLYRSQREPGEVVGLDAWIPSGKPTPIANESGMDCWNCSLARGDGRDACERHTQAEAKR